MEFKTRMDGEVDTWKEVTLIYSSALKAIGTKLEILNDEFQHVHRNNPDRKSVVSGKRVKFSE